MTFPDALTAFGVRYVPEAAQPSLWYVPSDRYRMNFNTGDMRYNPAGNGPIRSVVTTNNLPYPAAYRVHPDQAFPIPAGFLDLLAGLNPLLDRDRALSLLNKGMVYCNTGDRQIDAVRVTAGATLAGERDASGRVWLKSYSIHDPAPTVAQVNAGYCWFWSTSIGTDGLPHYITRMGIDGRRHNVKMILMSEAPVWLASAELVPVTERMDALWK
jgi:hypothetical protein